MPRSPSFRSTSATTAAEDGRLCRVMPRVDDDTAEEKGSQPRLCSVIMARYFSISHRWRYTAAHAEKIPMDVTADRAGPVSLPQRGSALEVLGVATRLGLTSFGGPIAHLGYFHAEYVVRRKWLDEQTYADLVALCQFLPGPASSQVGIAVGITRAGLLGGLASWVGFTLPSALALVAFAFGLQAVAGTDVGWLHGLKVVAVAVVAQAVWGMARALAPDRERASIALLAAMAMLAWPSSIGQVLIIAVAGLVGWRFLSATGRPRPCICAFRSAAGPRRSRGCCSSGS
jgi:chromate transport protein ChrA